MKILNKKMLAFILIVAFAILMPFGNVKAALQANPTTHYNSANRKTPTDWMTQIRSMEKGGEAMGLNETLNSDLRASSASNGIDVHMMRSTEYGAIAILAASGYGSSSKLNNTMQTTTGNKTGVYFSGKNYEFVAGGLKGSIFSGVNTKYYDAYNTNDSNSYDYNTNKSHAKIGDALGDGTTTNPGCANWHGAPRADWVYSRYPYFERGYNGLFYFDGYNASIAYSGRGVAVVGAGL